MNNNNNNMENNQAPKIEGTYKKKSLNGLLIKSLIALLVILAIAIGLFGRSGNIGKGKTVDTYKDEISMDNIEIIRISLTEADLEIKEIDSDKARFEIKGESKNTFDFNTDNRSFTIEEIQGSFFSVFSFGNSSAAKVTVYVPRSYGKDYEIKRASGDFEFESLRGENISIEQASGDTEGGNINAVKLRIDSLSGKTELDNTEANEIKINLASGDMSLDRISAEMTKIDMASGDVGIREITGNVDITQTSGSSTIEYAQLPEKISIHTTSGEAQVKLPEDSIIDLAFDKTSGKLNNSIETSEGARCKVDVEMTSGTVTLH